jgi:nickel/cobalt exporter
LRVALSAALLHVLSGFAVFVVLRLIMGQMPSMFGRNSLTFTAVGYAFIVLAGIMTVAQSFRPAHGHDGTHALTLGIGLLPCPLTISVLGFAWAQGSAAMVGIVLVSLALGISLTIGIVAMAAILARRSLGAALGCYMPALDRGSRVLQAMAGVFMIAIGLYTLLPLVL